MAGTDMNIQKHTYNYTYTALTFCPSQTYTHQTDGLELVDEPYPSGITVRWSLTAIDPSPFNTKRGGVHYGNNILILAYEIIRNT